MQLIDTSIVNVALPHIMGNLGADLDDASWVVTAYVFANVLVIPMTGWLSAYFGRRRYYIGSIILFVTASVLCGQSTSIWQLVAFRFIQGIGGGGLLPVSRVVMVESYPPEDLGLANAIFGMGVVTGPTIGPTLGGWLTTNYSWPWIFMVNLPVGIVAVILAFLFVPEAEGRKSPSRIDWWGIGLLMLGFGSLQVVLERGEKDNWFSAHYILILTILAIMGIIAFIWREMTAENPVVDIRVLRNRNLAIGSIFGFIMGFGLYSSVFIFPVFTQNLLGYSAMQTGLILLPGGLAAALMMPVIGILLKKGVPPQLLATFGFGIFFIFCWVLSKQDLQSGQMDFFWPLILRGLGLGSLSVPINTIALTGIFGHDLSEGSGFLSMSRQLGGSFGIALVATFIDWREAFHRNILGSYINRYRQPVQQRVHRLVSGLMARGSSLSTAHQQTDAILNGIVMRQSILMSYEDTFLVVGVFFLVCIPLLLFTFQRKKVKNEIKKRIETEQNRRISAGSYPEQD